MNATENILRKFIRILIVIEKYQQEVPFHFNSDISLTFHCLTDEFQWKYSLFTQF